MTKIVGIVAPACRLDPAQAEEVRALAAVTVGTGVELRFHPQCFLSEGHFAGPDAVRADAFVEMANDPEVDAVWFARGGYGSGRLGAGVFARLGAAARAKTYLGYSDCGMLLSRLYKDGIGTAAHGPMPADIKRQGGAVPVTRALRWLTARDPESLEATRPRGHEGAPRVAFNLTILSHLIGTGWLPDLSGHAVMLEDVDEYMYRIDRALFHITAAPELRNAAGLMLGRVSAVPDNDPEFQRSEEQVIRHWCGVSGIAYLGRCDIGHDTDNKVVVFGG